eukprot:390399_1
MSLLAKGRATHLRTLHHVSLLHSELFYHSPVVFWMIRVLCDVVDGVGGLRGTLATKSIYPINKASASSVFLCGSKLPNICRFKIQTSDELCFFHFVKCNEIHIVLLEGFICKH